MEIAAKILDSSVAFKELEFKKLCMDLSDAAFRQMQDSMKLAEEVLQLKLERNRLYDEIEELHKQLRVKAEELEVHECDIIYNEKYPYILVKGHGDTRYCTNCWMNRHRLVQMSYEGVTSERWNCPECKTYVNEGL